MKKIIILSLFGCAVIAAVLLMFSFLAHQNFGHLEIQTNDAAAKITLIPPNSSKGTLIGVGKHVQTSLNAGHYLVEAIDQNRASRMEVNVPNKGNLSIFLSVNPLNQLNEVANFSAQELSISGSDIEFLNTALQQIYDYNLSTGAEHAVASDLYPVASILWINHQLAVVIDSIGNPHLLSGQNDSVLPITTTSSNNPAIQDFTVNTGGDFAYAQGGNIYLSKAGKIASIGQNNSSEIQVRLASDGMLFVNGINPTDPSVTTIDVGVPTQSSAYFITATGQKLTYPGSATINDAAWSTDSQTIAVSTNNRLTTYNYKTNKTTVVTLQGISSNTSFNWIDANNLLYVDKGIVWDYMLSQNISYKLVSLPGTINHELPFVVSDTGSTYFSTDSSNNLSNGNAIYKLVP